MIKIDFINTNKYDFDFDPIKLCKNIAKEVFKLEKMNYNFSFGVSVVSKYKIKSLNKRLRNINKVTDVLSFPSIDCKKTSDFKGLLKNNLIDVFDKDTKTIFIGDIVICQDMVIKQAKLYGHSNKREFAFLITHSLLHLLGYDHMKKVDEEKMFKKQEQILKNLKIYR